MPSLRASFESFLPLQHESLSEHETQQGTECCCKGHLIYLKRPMSRPKANRHFNDAQRMGRTIRLPSAGLISRRDNGTMICRKEEFVKIRFTICSTNSDRSLRRFLWVKVGFYSVSAEYFGGKESSYW